MRTRSQEPELLDLEIPPLEERGRIVGYLAFVNRWLGGTSATALHLRGIQGRAIVLDVAAGAADMSRDLARRFPNLSFVAFDRSTWMLSFAAGIPRIRGDVRRFPFRDRSVDYIMTTHFFHHLSDDQIVETLREFGRVAKRGIIINDLLRSRRALLWIKLLTLWANHYVQVDGPQSVRKSFTISEIEALARRAGLGWLRAREHFGHRFTLAGERPDPDA
ncbi:MAG TPA: methyltransferase domain-containing protein [Planctomycetota bacterium]|nr:methyltransferase domain-containing protein [Planctomycetota bacterium]